MQYMAVMCRTCIGVVFLVAAFAKLVGPGGFRALVSSLRQMRVLPDRLVRPTAIAVIAAEAVIPLALATPLVATAVGGFGLTVMLLTAFGVAILISIRRGTRTPCRCFGTSTVPLSSRHLVRNALLGAVAVLGVVASTAGGQADPAGLAVAAFAGLVIGSLVTVMDDIIELFRPVPTTARRR
jgi:hypothetical protein